VPPRLALLAPATASESETLDVVDVVPDDQCVQAPESHVRFLEVTVPAFRQHAMVVFRGRNRSESFVPANHRGRESGRVICHRNNSRCSSVPGWRCVGPGQGAELDGRSAPGPKHTLVAAKFCGVAGKSAGRAGGHPPV